MTFTELLSMLLARGIRLSVDDRRIRYHASNGTITKEITDALELHHRALLQALGPNTLPSPEQHQ